MASRKSTARTATSFLLEDVHFLSGKSGTQEELSNTLESLMNANKKIIYSSCYLPSDIPKLNENSNRGCAAA
jgi:chromosomal replication initiation ATPase DnaA